MASLLESTTLLERLIEDLRTLALADAGQLPLYQEALDPVALLHGAVQALAEQARTGGVALRVETAGRPARCAGRPAARRPGVEQPGGQRPALYAPAAAR